MNELNVDISVCVLYQYFVHSRNMLNVDYLDFCFLPVSGLLKLWQ